MATFDKKEDSLLDDSKVDSHVESNEEVGKVDHTLHLFDKSTTG